MESLGAAQVRGHRRQVHTAPRVVPVIQVGLSVQWWVHGNVSTLPIAQAREQQGASGIFLAELLFESPENTCAQNRPEHLHEMQQDMLH